MGKGNKTVPRIRGWGKGNKLSRARGLNRRPAKQGVASWCGFLAAKHIRLLLLAHNQYRHGTTRLTPTYMPTDDDAEIQPSNRDKIVGVQLTAEKRKVEKSHFFQSPIKNCGTHTPSQ